MGDCSRNREVYPLFLDSISNEREWLVRGDQVSFGVSEDKKLELRLGLPGDERVDIGNNKNESRERDESLLSLGCYSSMASKTDNNNSNNNNSAGAKRGFLDTVEAKAGDDTWLINHKGYQNQKLSSSDKPVGKIFSSPWSSCSSPSPSSSVFQMKIHHQQQQPKPSFLQFPSIPQSLPVTAKECSQTCITKVELQNPEKKACSPASPNATVPNSSQKRNASAPVVGWPPIRSFRKNIGSSSSLKPAPELRSLVPTEVTGEKSEGCPKGLFVKINMDGVPIGRKVDLNAHNSYEKLSFAVDKLFRDLLAAQNNSSAAGNQNKEESKAITGLLDGSGEYTLVYEDNEGDRMLVGDVPWHMFVSAVKRLRVLKSSELSALCFGGNKQGRTPPDHGVK